MTLSKRQKLETAIICKVQAENITGKNERLAVICNACRENKLSAYETTCVKTNIFHKLF